MIRMTIGKKCNLFDDFRQSSDEKLSDVEWKPKLLWKCATNAFKVVGWENVTFMVVGSEKVTYMKKGVSKDGILVFYLVFLIWKRGIKRWNLDFPLVFLIYEKRGMIFKWKSEIKKKSCLYSTITWHVWIHKSYPAHLMPLSWTPYLHQSYLDHLMSLS